MAIPLGTVKDTFYVCDKETYKKLHELVSVLHSGTDRERDYGHKLMIWLDDFHSFTGTDLYTT